MSLCDDWGLAYIYMYIYIVLFRLKVKIRITVYKMRRREKNDTVIICEHTYPPDTHHTHTHTPTHTPTHVFKKIDQGYSNVFVYEWGKRVQGAKQTRRVKQRSGKTQGVKVCMMGQC